MTTNKPSSFSKLSLQTIISSIIVLLLFSNQSHALEIGELTLSSKLGRPLSAQLQITNFEQLSPQQLIVKQAPISTYEKLGIEAPTRVYNLSIKTNNNGLVTISSRDAINEPYLHFILMFQWPTGEINREYKLLIDP